MKKGLNRNNKIVLLIIFLIIVGFILFSFISFDKKGEALSDDKVLNALKNNDFESLFIGGSGLEEGELSTYVPRIPNPYPSGTDPCTDDADCSLGDVCHLKSNLCYTPSCNDTDGGNDIYTKGTVTHNIPEWNPSATDKCSGISARIGIVSSGLCDGPNCHVTEYSCVNDTFARIEVSCPGGCLSGECRKLVCSADNDCVRDEICSSGSCVECVDDSQCSSEGKCSLGKCVRSNSCTCMGDVNHDGRVNRTDIFTMILWASWPPENSNIYNVEDGDCSDLNGDGFLGPHDMLEVFMYLRGFADQDFDFACGEDMKVLRWIGWNNVETVGSYPNLKYKGKVGLSIHTLGNLAEGETLMIAEKIPEPFYYYSSSVTPYYSDSNYVLWLLNDTSDLGLNTISYEFRSVDRHAIVDTCFNENSDCPGQNGTLKGKWGLENRNVEGDLEWFSSSGPPGDIYGIF